MFVSYLKNCSQKNVFFNIFFYKEIFETFKKYNEFKKIIFFFIFFSISSDMEKISKKIILSLTTNLVTFEHYKIIYVTLKFFSVVETGQLNLREVVSNTEGFSLLHSASQEGLLPIVHALIISGCELDVLDKDQNSPLMVAIQSFKNNVVKYLIKSGASTDLKVGFITIRPKDVFISRN